MPTRDQLTEERVEALIDALAAAGVIDETEAGDLQSTRDFREAAAVRDESPEPPAVSRSKISSSTVDDYRAMRADGDLQGQIDVLFHVLTGVDPTPEPTSDTTTNS